MHRVIQLFMLSLCFLSSILTYGQTSSIQIKQRKRSSPSKVIDELFPIKKEKQPPRRQKNNNGKHHDVYNILPTAIQKLAPYNVVVASYNNIYEAQKHCLELRNLGHPALIYNISSTNYYVFIVSCYNEPYAQQYLNIAMENYPNAWIFKLDKNQTQYRNTIYDQETKSYDVVEMMPSFPGGPSALLNYLNANIKYPVVAEENGIQGRVICTFIVERDGSISNITVAHSVDPSLDMEAIRVIRNMPKWTPGLQDGAPVRVKYTVPVTF